MRAHGLFLSLMISMPLALAGCANSFSLSSMFDEPELEQVDQPEQSVVATTDNGIRYRAESRDSQAAYPKATQQSWRQYRTPDNLYQPKYTHKGLTDYAQQLSMQLIENAHNLSTDSLIGVASFVNFDGKMQNATAIGNQLAEVMIANVQQYGLAVIDFKAMPKVQVNQRGDFVFSRDARHLSATVEMDYVLSGTLIQNEKGVRVNARILSTQSKIVVSSASIHIPHFIITALQPNVEVINPAP